MRAQDCADQAAECRQASTSPASLPIAGSLLVLAGRPRGIARWSCQRTTGHALAQCWTDALPTNAVARFHLPVWKVVLPTRQVTN